MKPGKKKKAPRELTPREREIKEFKEKIRRDEHEVINCPNCNRQMVQKSTPMVMRGDHMWQYDCGNHTTLSGSRYPNPAPDKWYVLDFK